MSKPPDPNSRMSRALLALQHVGDISHGDFLRILGRFCATKEQIHNLSSEIRGRGFIERVVRITPAAIDAVGRIKP